MTRPKVPDDKRQRTAQACDSCKRRKQKCNGQKPCQTCLRRKLMCCYTPSSGADHAADTAASPTKRRHLDTSPPSINAALESASVSAVSAVVGGEVVTSPVQGRGGAGGGNGGGEPMQGWEQQVVMKSEQQRDQGDLTMGGVASPAGLAASENGRQGSVQGFKKLPSRGTVNGVAEETNIYTETRMLQDQTGRLLYIGDSSTLSILQLTRIIVENTAGTEMGSPFIDDPKRHRILESVVEFPPNVNIPGPLPDKDTADVLIASYFTNTCGLIEILDKDSFLRSVDDCYRDPPSATKIFLCNLYLVLAVGLLLAAPAHGTHDEMIVQKQLGAQPDRAELFFQSARAMCDPGAGFEDADFWSIQALALMTIYMLILSKRNTAYAYLGMAVRSAYAMGLHREETMRDVIFSPIQMRVRRNLWKTLYILDRFLAATLGRPTAISEDDCSCKILPTDEGIDLRSMGGYGLEHVHSTSLDACVETAHVIGVTLKVFSKRKISTAKVQEIVDMSKNWDQASGAQAYRRQSTGGLVSPAHAMAALHVNLLSLHSLVLLTRQLFVMHNWMLVEERSGIKKSPHIRESPMARFSEACVIASYRTIRLARSAWDDGYLPRRNPFIIYFIFASSLVILMNQFSSLYFTDEYSEIMQDAIELVTYCAEIDPQAARVLDIISRFSIVVDKWTRDHAYPAPPLSNDFSCLYVHHNHHHRSSRAAAIDPLNHTGFTTTHGRNSLNNNDPGLLTPPSRPKLPLHDILTNTTQPLHHHTRPTTSTTTGHTPPNHPHQPHHHADTTMGASRPSVSAHSSSAMDSPETALSGGSGNIEFEFDGLWSKFSNHLPPVSSVAPGLGGSLVAMQFPPPVIGTPTEPYDKPGI